MKHSNDDDVLQTNLLQAFQKNKIIQGKLSERQRSYYIDLIKNMQDYNLKEKLNKELLYTWKKENYVRQFKKNLQEYERKRFGVRDAYYEYQATKLDCIIAGQQGLVIPPIEEERRLNVHAKYRQFLQDHPLQTIPSMRIHQIDHDNIDQEKQKKEEEDARAVEETWKPIHAQSSLGLRKTNKNILPSIKRSSTMDEIRQSKSFTSLTTSVTSNVLVTTATETINGSSEEKRQPVSLPTKITPIRSTLPEGIEPLVITSDTLQKQTGADLIEMRSVRRPKRNPTDLNLTFEARKRLYQINKRVYDYQLCQRKCGLQYNSQFDRPQQIDPADDEENLLINISETTRRRYEDRHLTDKTYV